jgi:5-hydroxyisourate hydrolase
MISTHILDTTLGLPAKDVRVVLEKSDGKVWSEIFESQTNSDGRVAFDCPYHAGDYRLKFGTLEYFNKHNQESFFLNAEVSFRITDTNRKYHVPILLNPYSYSTYRGS